MRKIWSTSNLCFSLKCQDDHLSYILKFPHISPFFWKISDIILKIPNKNLYASFEKIVNSSSIYYQFLRLILPSSVNNYWFNYFYYCYESWSYYGIILYYLCQSFLHLYAGLRPNTVHYFKALPCTALLCDKIKMLTTNGKRLVIRF